MKSELDSELQELFEVISTGKKLQREELDNLVSDSFETMFWAPLVTEEKKPKKTKKKKVIKEEYQEPEVPENPLIERSLGLLSVPSNEKVQQDPLTPVDQNFVTFEQLQKHYTTFLGRIQQQLSTLGGGGEVNLAFMVAPVRTITGSTYTITQRDYYIGVNHSGAVTLTLPMADRNGRKYIIKDELGEASKGTNRYITIFPQAGDLIDGKDRAILAYDFGSLTFIWNNNSWRIV
jgi:hypothetical protein